MKSKKKTTGPFRVRIVAGPDDSCPVVVDSATGYVDRALLHQFVQAGINAGALVLAPVPVDAAKKEAA